MDEISKTDEDYNFRDKRVDKMLSASIYKDAETFYSPIKSWLFFSLISIIGSAGVIFFFAVSDYWYIFCIIIISSYLINAYANNSFILTADKLIVVNPNFPFRRQKIYELSEITDVKIDRSNWHWTFSVLFLVFGRNYVQIKKNEKVKKYYCINLQQYYDYGRQFTKLTIDDLYNKLNKSGVSVTYNDNVD